MIEEIKKEVMKNHKPSIDENGQINGYIWLPKLFEILDKYKNQETFLNERIDTLKDTQLKQLNKISELEKYKNVWKKLENMFINHIDAKAMNYQDNKLNPNEILNKMEELEQKHNLGGVE